MTPNENPTPAATPSSETPSPGLSPSRKAEILAEAIKNHPRRLRSAAIVRSNDERTRLFNESFLRNPEATSAARA